MIPQGQLKTEVRFKPCCGKCSQIQHATIQASTKNQNLGGFLVNSVVYFKKKPSKIRWIPTILFSISGNHMLVVLYYERQARGRTQDRTRFLSSSVALTLDRGIIKVYFHNSQVRNESNVYYFLLFFQVKAYLRLYMMLILTTTFNLLSHFNSL